MLHLTHQASFDALGLDDLVSTGRIDVAAEARILIPVLDTADDWRAVQVGGPPSATSLRDPHDARRGAKQSPSPRRLHMVSSPLAASGTLPRCMRPCVARRFTVPERWI